MSPSYLTTRFKFAQSQLSGHLSEYKYRTVMFYDYSTVTMITILFLIWYQREPNSSCYISA